MQCKVMTGLMILATAGPLAAQPDVPSHGRPYFMPEGERRRIRTLIERQEWAAAEYARMKAAAEKGKGFEAAFLYALGGEAKYVPAARDWLLGKYGPKASWVRRYAKQLGDPNHFKAGMPHLANVYYDIDVAGLVGFDWVCKGLDAGDRKTIEQGILTLGRYRMRAMGRWTQTANLVFKPTYMVAMIGLATGDRACLDWGFHRNRRGGGGHAGYFGAMDRMLRDGGPWHEAPIYPIAHKGLLCMANMSRLRSLYDGRDWFAHKTPGGGSVKGLMDYYIDTAYPIEKTADGAAQIRVATCGDGATGPGGDLFLVKQAAGGLKCHDELAAAYAASGDPRYAALVGMIPGYKPNLLGRRGAGAGARLPAAPSKIWPTYGLAMLRSDESPAYWTGPKAIAVFQVMSQGYGHDHRDKFSITLHGAGRLFYPDYNAIQYENQAIGWTRNSVCHNTLVVDGQDTQNAEPTGIRHEFTPEVKFLATSASGVFEGVDQTRALLLTREYLLDVFHAAGNVPHTYDYLLHSFGRAENTVPNAMKPSRAMAKRYWLVQNTEAMSTAKMWSTDLVIDGDERGRKAALRVMMAPQRDTLVTRGVWGEQLAKLVAARYRKKTGAPRLHRLTMLAARRNGRRETVFVSTHEPMPDGAAAQVVAVATAVRSRDAVLVRIRGKTFTDYAAVAFGAQKARPGHVLAVGDGLFAFRNYGYLRIPRAGGVIARGGWTGFRVPARPGRVTVNGHAAAAKRIGQNVVFGDVSAPPSLPPAQEPSRALPTTVSPAVVRVFPRDRREVTLTLRNTTAGAVSGLIELDLPKGFATQPHAPRFGPVSPGETAQVRFTFVTSDPPIGKRTIPYRIVYRTAGQRRETRTTAMALTAAVGPTLELVYQHPKPAVYRLHSPKYTAEFDMFHGLCRRLADDDDTVRLAGGPLFTFSDGEKPMLFAGTAHAFTWPRTAPADLLAHAYDRCRWRAVLLGDRILVRMDRNWTQFKTAHFTIGGKWHSPAAAPTWQRIVAIDDAGKEYDARPAKRIRVVAAELAFPKSRWHLAFQFQPPCEVTFDGTTLTFDLPTLTGATWSVGFLRPNRLDAWRTGGVKR